MDPRPSLWSDITEIAGSAGAVEQRAQELLEPLHRLVPYVAAWIAVRDPETRRHRPVGRDGDTVPLERYVARPDADDELEQFRMNRRRPPVRASDVPVPLSETIAWGEYLLPAGFRDGFVVGLFAEDGRHLGFVSLLGDLVSLLGGDAAQPTTGHAVVLGRARPLLARALDRLPSVAAAAQLPGDAVAGAVLTRAGHCLPVPGLPSHPLLTSDSQVVAVAREHAGTAGAHSSFLSPWAGGLVRITVLDCRDEKSDHLAVLVLVHPAGDLAGLDPGDLQVLGGLLQGWDDERINAGCAVPRAAAQAEGMARRLRFPSTHALLVHVAREGRYVPPALWP
jgi:hypothetical protein